jgi:hypothetical protein
MNAAHFTWLNFVAELGELFRYMVSATVTSKDKTYLNKQINNAYLHISECCFCKYIR